MPDTLFKYTSLHTAKLVLENQTLRWTTPATLNDPYDIQFDLRGDIDRNQVVEDALEKCWSVYNGDIECADGHPLEKLMKVYRQIRPPIAKKFFFENLRPGIHQSLDVMEEKLSEVNQTVRAGLSTCKILCLTDSPTNQLMWAYYADSNRGVVLRFEQEPGADSPYSMAKEVRYKKEIPRLFSEDELSDFLSGIVVFDKQRRIDDLVYTKSEAWSHEREWRLYSGDGRNKHAPHEDVKFGHRELTGVILGCRMGEQERLEIVELVKQLYPHAEILQSSTLNHMYELELLETKY